MRVRTLLPVLAVTLAIVSALSGCTSRSSDRREYTLQGQIVSVSPDHKSAVIKHEEIKGFMAAMTMSYHVRDTKEFENLSPGDLINATLVVVANDAYLKDVKRVGSAPLEKPAADAAPPASFGFELLKTGEPVPNAQFVDQDGKKRDFASFKGSMLLVTFVYTSCPMPTFCPLMDRHFVTIQDALKKDARLNVRLASVSIDPIMDTPVVLKKHAREIGANPKLWTFLTGDRDAIDQFAARFGVSVSRSPTDQRNITHNLRTAIVDRDGNLAKVYTGNEWTPDEALADVKALAHGD